LGDVDALIGSLDRLIAKNRDVKQAAMQQLITGRARLPGFHDTWVEKTLGSILERGRLGGNYPNQENETPYPLMKMGNLSRGYFNTAKVEYVASRVIPDREDRLRYGDVLLNTRNTLDLVGKVAIWRDKLPIAYYNSNLMRLEFDPNYIASNAYVNYALNSAGSVARLRSLATGTTSVAAIYSRDLMQFSVSVPSLAEQTAIAEVLTDVDNEITALENRRDKTRLLKQGMMQELLTGRTRLV
jgi:type I restriction enzyme, S subunit